MKEKSLLVDFGRVGNGSFASLICFIGTVYD